MVTVQLWGPPGSSAANLIFVGGGNHDLFQGVAGIWTLGPERARRDANLMEGVKRGVCECLAVDPEGRFSLLERKSSA